MAIKKTDLNFYLDQDFANTDLNFSTTEGRDYVYHESSSNFTLFGVTSISNKNKELAIPPINSLIFGNRLSVGFDSDLLLLSLDFIKEQDVTSTSLNFSTSDDGPITFPEYILVNSISGYASGVITIENKTSYLLPSGIPPSLKIGSPSLKNYITRVEVLGIVSTLSVGRPTAVNYSKDAKPKTWVSSEAGRPLIYNLTQYQKLSGINSALYGKPALLGGVWYLGARGYDASKIGTVVLINTTANQEVKPKGIDDLATGATTVSPRILYAKGFSALTVAAPDVRTPVLFPTGIHNDTYGLQTVWFHTRLLSPNGVDSYQSGYSYVLDPTQFIQTPSLITSAIFGDTAIKNLSVFVRAPAIDDGAFSDYTIATNSNRQYELKGISSLAIGDSIVFNETPQIFTSSIIAGAFGLSSIAYRIRSIGVTGFDLSAISNPNVTKSPEIAPKSINPSDFGVNTIWHKVRIIRPLGFDSAKLTQPTVWFKYRYAAPKAWQSSNFAKPTLTHNLREVIVSGKTSDLYGKPWVSQGTRVIDVSSINEANLTNHFVGRHQKIEPTGYISTLFGERVVPEASVLRPLGFKEQWGSATISLWIRDLFVNGFLTIGSASSDRFGQARFYNLTQYIRQDFDINSGLVPPLWSQWTLIENRNKQLNITGFLSQRFGYNQIDNKASALLPIGIMPPVAMSIEKSMISHAVRRIKPIGIEQPTISSWSAVYNAAKVLLPNGFDQNRLGDPALANTRRYYNNIGRFESLEFGNQMIAYRIRKVDIESRYSIAPPQIELPTADLYTRYVGFSGYETTKYGLPALSIHFNKIETRWSHQEKLGMPRLHNVTPEIMPWGINVEAHGAASIRTEWREIKAFGDTATLFGSIVVADTKRSLMITGWVSEAKSYLHKVVRLGAAPYATQQIRLDEGNGDGFRSSNIGNPLVNQNVLYTKSWTSSGFGQQFIWSNNIMPIGIGFDFIPNALSVRNKTNAINVLGIETTKIELGKPRMSHHTIWATREISEQARVNNGSSWVDITTTTYGTAKVESTIRGITPSDFNRNRNFGIPAMSLRLQLMTPDSFRYSNFGIPSIPFTPKNVLLRSGVYSEVFGRPGIAHDIVEGLYEIRPNGIGSFKDGNYSVGNYKRYLGAKSFLAERMGNRVNGDKPYMWQGLRVGEFVPTSIGAGDTALYGSVSISLKVRQINPKGFDGFLSQYNTPLFNERMRVYNSNKELPITQKITAIGINADSNISAQDVRLGRQFIRPDGNSNQFRKGGYHA